MSEEKAVKWPLAKVVGIEDGMILVEFIDAIGEGRGIAVSVSKETAWEVGQVVDLSRKDDCVVRNPVKSERVSIKAEKLYSISVDGKKVKGLFKETGSMSGMKKLVRMGGEKHCEIVVDCPEGVMEVLSGVLGVNDDLDVTVVKASPNFVDEMMGIIKKGDRE